MAIAFVQAVRASVANNGTLSITPTSGNALVAWVAAENGSQAITVTDTTDSRSFTQFGTSLNDGSNAFTVAVFLLSNVTGGGAKTITFGVGSGGADVVVAEYSGGVNSIDATKSANQELPGTATNAITPGSYTVATGDLSTCWCIGIDSSTAIALVAGSASTSRDRGTIVTGGLNRWSVLEDNTSTGSVTMAFTDATNGGSFGYDTYAASLSTTALGQPDDGDVTFVKFQEANELDDELWQFVFDSHALPPDPTNGTFFNTEVEM